MTLLVGQSRITAGEGNEIFSKKGLRCVNCTTHPEGSWKMLGETGCAWIKLLPKLLCRINLGLGPRVVFSNF